MEQNNEIKWNQKPINVILLLVFFFPLGLYFMWKNKMWTGKTRWIITSIIVLILIFPKPKNLDGMLDTNLNHSKIKQNIAYEINGITLLCQESLAKKHGVSIYEVPESNVYFNPVNDSILSLWETVDDKHFSSNNKHFVATKSKFSYKTIKGGIKIIKPLETVITSGCFNYILGDWKFSRTIKWRDGSESYGSYWISDRKDQNGNPIYFEISIYTFSEYENNNPAR